jgi:hypothetical protein
MAAGKKVSRPAIKEGIKLGINATEAVKHAVHEGRESLTDLVAEAKQEAEIDRRATQPDLEPSTMHRAD